MPKNIEACAHYPNAEFVILDYDSEDGLEQWIKENYRSEIESGKIRYAKYDEKTSFKMRHAKNMAHRIATGDILCNLDADNFIAPGYAEWLNSVFQDNPNSITRLSRFGMGVYHTLGISAFGVYGRIAIMRDNFFNILHGYDEAGFNGWGGDDDDLLNRARVAGLRYVPTDIRYIGKCIQHSDEMRTENLSEEDVGGSLSYLGRKKTKFLEKVKHTLSDYPVNPDVPVAANEEGKVGCGKVFINFDSTPTLLEALPPVEPTPSNLYSQTRTSLHPRINLGGASQRSV